MQRYTIDIAMMLQLSSNSDNFALISVYLDLQSILYVKI